MKHIMKKHIGFYACAILLIFILAGCGADVEPVAVDDFEVEFDDVNIESSSEITLNWMGHWLDEDKRETLVREVAQEFSLLNPGVTVNLKFTQEILGIRSKQVTAEFIAEMIRSGDFKWDIVWLDDNIYQMVAEELDDPEWGKEHLVDFEQVEEFEQSQKPFILSDPAYKAQTGDQLVGPYVEGYYYALYYNKDIADEMGLEIKEQGMTYDDLLGYTKTVYDYNQQNGTDYATFYEANDWITTEILFQNLIKSELGDFDEAKAQVRSAEKEDALLKTFQAFEELGQYDPLIASQNDNVWYDTRHLVLDDQALFSIQGTWMYSHWQAIDKEKIKKMIPVEMPAFQEVDYYLGGYIPTWAVFKDAPNRDAAVDLLMFWATPHIAEKWIRYTKNPTGVAGNLATAETGSDAFEQYQQGITDKYGANVHYSADVSYILGKENQSLTPQLDSQLISLLTGQTTAEEAFQLIMAQAE